MSSLPEIKKPRRCIICETVELADNYLLQVCYDCIKINKITNLEHFLKPDYSPSITNLSD